MAVRILIIEDGQRESNVLRAAVAELGCEIAGIGRDWTEARRLVEQNRADLALVHIDPSHEEGFILTRELRVNHHVPVILLSPPSRKDILQQACASGCTAYLVEPVRTDELDAAIRIALHHETTVSEEQQVLREEANATRAALIRNKHEIDSLLGRLIDSQEEERRHLARELHDDLAQLASAAALLVDRIAITCQPLPIGRRSDFELLKSTIDQLSDGIRSMSHRLHPGIIEDLGLPQALRSLARDYRALGLELAESINEVSAVIPLPTATSLYRIAQEALHNTLRHAPGAPARVSLKSNDGHIEMRVEDAGPGFSLVHAKPKPGLGLISMQERAGFVGGTFVLKTNPGEGTAVLVTAPIGTHAAPTDPTRRRSSADA